MTDFYVSDGEDINISIEDINLSIPRGGPVYVRDMVGPLTKISDFEAAVVEELEILRREVCVDLTDIPDEDLCVDILKIIAEDELVNKAFEEAFKDVGKTSDSLEASGAQPDARRKDDSRISSSEQACSEGSGITLDASAPYESSLVRTDDNGEFGGNGSHKRKRRGRKVTVRNQHAEKDRSTVKRLASGMSQKVAITFPRLEQLPVQLRILLCYFITV